MRFFMYVGLVGFTIFLAAFTAYLVSALFNVLPGLASDISNGKLMLGGIGLMVFSGFIIEAVRLEAGNGATVPELEEDDSDE